MGVVIDKYDGAGGNTNTGLHSPFQYLCSRYTWFFCARSRLTVPSIWWLATGAVRGLHNFEHCPPVLGAQLASGYDERSRLYGWREIFVISGMGLCVHTCCCRVAWRSGADHKKSPAWDCSPVVPADGDLTLPFVPEMNILRLH